MKLYVISKGIKSLTRLIAIRKPESLIVADSYLRNAEDDLDTAMRWLGRSKRQAERDRALRVLTSLRELRESLR